MADHTVDLERLTVKPNQIGLVKLKQIGFSLMLRRPRAIKKDCGSNITGSSLQHL